jgi:hypothetical protein
MRAERQDTDIVRVVAAFRLPGLRYRSFGNRPVRAGGVAPAALSAQVAPQPAPADEATRLAAPGIEAGIRPIAATAPALAVIGGGRVVPLTRPAAVAVPIRPQPAPPAAMPVEFSLIRQAIGGAPALPPSPAMLQAAGPDRSETSVEVPGGLPLIATAFTAIAAPELPLPLAAGISRPRGLAAAGRPRSTRYAVAALSPTLAVDLD